MKGRNVCYRQVPGVLSEDKSTVQARHSFLCHPALPFLSIHFCHYSKGEFSLLLASKGPIGVACGDIPVLCESC